MARLPLPYFITSQIIKCFAVSLYLQFILDFFLNETKAKLGEADFFVSDHKYNDNE
jgi:hypothetical protein